MIVLFIEKTAAKTTSPPRTTWSICVYKALSRKPFIPSGLDKTERERMRNEHLSETVSTYPK